MKKIAIIAALSLAACDTTAGYEETPPGVQETSPTPALIPVLALLVIGAVIVGGK